MESIYLLIPLVLVFTAVAVWIYVWAVNSGQYDDLDKEAEQLLFDDDVGAVREPPVHDAHKTSVHKSSVHETSVGATGRSPLQTRTDQHD